MATPKRPCLLPGTVNPTREWSLAAGFLMWTLSTISEKCSAALSISASSNVLPNSIYVGRTLGR
jgi:hypothetical protein